jgi:hypothetical protein
LYSLSDHFINLNFYTVKQFGVLCDSSTTLFIICRKYAVLQIGNMGKDYVHDHLRPSDKK